MSLSEMRAELRELRKEHMKPVSKMRKGDISAEIQKMKMHVETTPAAAATSSPPARKMRHDVENINDVKKAVFMTPVPSDKKAPKMEKAHKMAEKEMPAAKMSKKDKLKKMLAEMSDDE